MTETITYDYQQIRITGTLTTTSLLHCGDGDTSPVKEWSSRKEKGEKGHINTVCKDQGNKPYIPATTLRGSLRERCRKNSQNSEEALFGKAHDKEGVIGKVRVYDAEYQTTPIDKNDLFFNTGSSTSLHDGVSIDPITQTAKEHLLFCHEVVPVGTKFSFLLEADRITEKELDTLLALLCGWNARMQTAVGKGRSKGWGRLQWGESTTVEKLTIDTVQMWVGDDKADLPKWGGGGAETIKTPRDSGSDAIGFSIHPTAPLLVNDHARISEEKEKPKLEFMRTKEGKAVIPGSTLRGAVRAHAYRIMATIAHQHYGVPAQEAANKVESCIEKLFGGERFRSHLWISEAIAETTKCHPQFFNAVDRFTGGVSGSALYNVVAAECDVLRGECHLEERERKQSPSTSVTTPEGDWWKGLLLLVARDFIEGDFVIGWGKGRGYGAGRVSFTLSDGSECNSFPALLKFLEKDQDPQDWINALHEQVKQLRSEARSKAE